MDVNFKPIEWMPRYGHDSKSQNGEDGSDLSYNFVWLCQINILHLSSYRLCIERVALGRSLGEINTKL
jgi:hypothetical protein